MSAGDHRAIPQRFLHPTGTFTEFPAADLDRSLPELFARQARRAPGRVAFEATTGILSYRELDERSTHIAQAILERRGPRVEPVAVLLPRDSAVVAALGVLKAGKILVLLDPTHPPARNTAVLEEADAALVVTGRGIGGAGADVSDRDRRLDIDEVATGAAVELPSVAADALAAIVFTSGTTGRPKGAIHDHRSLLHLVREMINGARLTPEDRIPLLHPLTAIAGFRTMFTAFLSGGTLCVFDVGRQGLGALGRWLREERISFCQAVPTMFRHMVATLGPGDRFPNLRVIRLGGDVVTRRDFELYQTHFADHAALLVTYNASEVSTVAWFLADGATTFDGEVVPVGFAREGTEVLLLDEAGRRVAPGEVGEIVVRTRYMSHGYWRRPDLTAERFGPDPDGGPERVYRTGDIGRMRSDGCLFHLGRRDTQVKVRGVRIEPAEVEAALLDDPGLAQAVVLARGDGDDARLVAYVVTEHTPAPSVDAIRRRLAGRLPTHLVPSVIVLMDALPLTPGGKVARHRLPAPGRERPLLEVPFVAPRSPVEDLLARIWGDALELDAVGVHDRFLDLGGTSLTAARIAARVLQAVSIELSAPALLAGGTVAEMALVVVTALAAAQPEELEGLLGEPPPGAAPFRDTSAPTRGSC